MRRTYLLYVLASLFFMAEISFFRITVWLPDFMLLLTLYAAMSLGLGPGLRLGLFSGFLCGIFSNNMLFLDMLIYPAAALLAVLLSTTLYVQNPAVQMFVCAIAVFMKLFTRFFYIELVSGGHMNFFSFIFDAWRMIVVTVVLAPAFFFLAGYVAAGSERE